MIKLVSAIKNLIVGLFTTGKHLGRHAITLQYPTEKWEMPERSRGIVVLLSDKETGELNCTVCLLCMKACPTNAIQIHYEKGEKGKRFLQNFVVDHGLCCFCGLCEEACNFAAIKMAAKYEFSTENKEDLVWDTKKLQEMGRDVPYEKPERKAKPIVKTAVAPKPAEEETGIKEVPASDTKPEEPKPAEDKTIDTVEENKETKPAEPENTEKKKPDKPEGTTDGT